MVIWLLIFIIVLRNIYILMLYKKIYFYTIKNDFFYYWFFKDKIIWILYKDLEPVHKLPLLKVSDFD